MTQFFKNKNRGFTQHHFSMNKIWQGRCTRNGAGFTLAEILVVLAIVGLLATIVLVSTKSAIEKAKIARSLRFSSSVHHAVGAYLVGEWKFEENGDDNCPTTNPDYNDVCDTSGYENHGKWVSGTREYSGISQLATAGKFIGASGGGNFVEINDSPTLDGMNELTIQAWLKALDELPVFSTESFNIVFKEGCYVLEVSTPEDKIRLRFFISPGIGWAANSLTDIYPFKIGQWYHLAASYYGGGSDITPRLTVYLNGHLISNLPLSWPNPPYPIKNADTLIKLGVNSYDGKKIIIDDIRIYQGELTVAQIRKLYAEGAEKHGLLVKE